MDRLTGPVPYRPRTDLVLDELSMPGTAALPRSDPLAMMRFAVSFASACVGRLIPVGGVAVFGGVDGAGMADFSFVKRRSVAAALM